MTTVYSSEALPPTSTTEVYLSPDELSAGTLYELESDYLERIAYCLDGQYFYGLHLEDRPGVFRLRLSKEPHKSYCDAGGVSSGAKPLTAVLPVHDIQLSQDYTHGDLVPLLVRQTAAYYKALSQEAAPSTLSPEIIQVKQVLFSAILSAWEAGTLPPPDEHGHLDLLVLRPL